MSREKFILCPVCEGRGTTVNPSIDANGITGSEWAEMCHEDPDFAEEYWSGSYDITCRACDGKRVVTEERIGELQQHAEDRELAARENGDFESYCGARDWRWG